MVDIHIFKNNFMQQDGKLVNLIIDANAPRLMNLIMDEVNKYDKFKKGEIKREFVSIFLIVVVMFF